MRRLVLPFVLLALAAALSASAFGRAWRDRSCDHVEDFVVRHVGDPGSPCAVHVEQGERSEGEVHRLVREDVAAVDDPARDDGAEAHRRGDGNVR